MLGAGSPQAEILPPGEPRLARLLGALTQNTPLQGTIGPLCCWGYRKASSWMTHPQIPATCSGVRGLAPTLRALPECPLGPGRLPLRALVLDVWLSLWAWSPGPQIWFTGVTSQTVRTEQIMQGHSRHTESHFSSQVGRDERHRPRAVRPWPARPHWPSASCRVGSTGPWL